MDAGDGTLIRVCGDKYDGHIAYLSKPPAEAVASLSISCACPFQGRFSSSYVSAPEGQHLTCSMIAAAEARVDAKIAQLKQLQAQITASLVQHEGPPT